MNNLPHAVQRYLYFFWKDCPAAAITLLIREVIPAALRDPSSSATDIRLRDSNNWQWYQSVSTLTRQRFHKLVSVTVRAARGYRVALTAGGNPIRRKSKSGPHGSYTVQLPI